MLGSFRLWLLVLAAVLVVAAFFGRSPYNTALPMEVDDLTPIQTQLEKLPREDRELVLAYLRRSNGDVLPAAFADPDEPFTARTFGEAIALQKDFRIKQGARDAITDARQAEREAVLAPLRKVSDIRVVKREVLTGDQIYGVSRSGAAVETGSAVAGDGHKVLVVTYRLHNLSAQAISSIKGKVRILSPAREEMTSCFIDHVEPISLGSSAEIRCGRMNREASVADTAFATMPMSQFSVEWEPRELVFADGTRLKTGLY